MTSIISRDDKLPLYKQVKLHILDTIHRDGLPPDTKMPSERELVSRLGVSRITVRQALKELVNEGHVTAQPGRGFFATGRPRRGHEIEVMRSFTETAIAHGRAPGSRLLAIDLVAADPVVAEGLRIEPGTEIVSLQRLRLLDGKPVAITHDWIDCARAPDLMTIDWSASGLSLYEVLRTRHGLKPHHGQTLLRAALASIEEGVLLNLRRPAAVLCAEQIAYDLADRPINMSRSVQDPVEYPLRLDQAGR